MFLLLVEQRRARCSRSLRRRGFSNARAHEDGDREAVIRSCIWRVFEGYGGGRAGTVPGTCRPTATPIRALGCRDRAVASSRRSTMLGGFALPRRPTSMLGVAAHRLRNQHARRRHRPSACRIAEPRHDRAEGAEGNGNSETNQPTAMLRVNGASRLRSVGVRFIHREQYAMVRAVRPGIG